MVEIITNHGSMVVELNTKKAPKTVKNFLGYVDSGFYDGTIFHRVIDGFMIQGGGFDEKMNKKETNAPIKNESIMGLVMLLERLQWLVRMLRIVQPASSTLMSPIIHF